MVVAGLCPQFCSHDEGAEEFLTGKAAELHLSLQMSQFFFVQMEGDDMDSQGIIDQILPLLNGIPTQSEHGRSLICSKHR